MRKIYGIKSFLAVDSVLQRINPNVFCNQDTDEIVSDMIDLCNSAVHKHHQMFGTAGYMITKTEFTDRTEFYATLDCEIVGDRIKNCD